MNDFNPGEGWREISHAPDDGDEVRYRDDRDRVRYWVREEPVPPLLPTEENTLICVTWKRGHPKSVLRLTDMWRDVDEGSGFRGDVLARLITDFEVLAEPRNQEQYKIDLNWTRDVVRRETAKAVLARVRKRVLGQTSWSRTGMDELAREFGVSE